MDVILHKLTLLLVPNSFAVDLLFGLIWPLCYPMSEISLQSLCFLWCNAFLGVEQLMITAGPGYAPQQNMYQQPGMSMGQPGMPMGQPGMPMGQPGMPMGQPGMPMGQPGFYGQM